MAVSAKRQPGKDEYGMGQRQSDAVIKGVSYFFLILGGVTMVVPFVWMIATSFKPASEIYMGNFFPQAATIENYTEVILKTLFPRWYLNSFICATLSTLSVVFFDSLVGYTMAKYDFPGKNVIFVLILSTLMVPTEMLIIPWYIMSVDFSWADTYWGIIFPGVITASGIFLMRQFMSGVPNDLMDAGRMDGVSEFGLYWRVALQLTKPALAALRIFNFLGNWNAYIWPLIVSSRREMLTLPVGLGFFSGEAGSDWHLIMTANTLSVVPLLTVFVFFQQQIIEGIALTGIKG